MKILLYIILGILLLIALGYIVLSISSRKQPELGLINGQLLACPGTPNCVCSEWQGEKSFVTPLMYTATADDAWRKIKQAIVETGGVIVTEQKGYLHSRYVTPFFRYIDDVELRLDEDQHVIHIRSASRVGRSDFGTNRKRVAMIRSKGQWGAN